MRLVAYVFSNPTLQTYVHLDEMGYADVVEDFWRATIFPPDKVADYTKALVMSHLKGFQLSPIYVG